MSDSPERHDDMTALIAQARAGDELAFGRLVARVYERIHRWAVGRTGDPDEADDVTQEVLVRLHRHLARYRGQARFTTWLYQITRNASIDLARRRGRRDQARRDYARLVDTNPPAQDAPARLEQAETLDAIREAFAELPGRQREVFDLVDLQGHPVVEAAEMLALKPVTARAHLFKARRAVRARLLGLDPELRKEGAG